MNIVIANSLSIYFETLFELNQKLIVVCGKGNENFENDKTLLDVLHNIPKLIPLKFNNRRLEIISDGLLEYGDEINYLKNDYNDLYNVNIPPRPKGFGIGSCLMRTF